MADIVKSYLRGDGVGLAGKIAQLCKSTSTSVDRGVATNSVPEEIKARVQCVPDFTQNSGTVAQIYIALYQDRRVALKTVAETTRRLLEEDTRRMNSGGEVNAIFTSEASGFVSVIGDSLGREICMRTEREMAAVVRTAIRTPVFDDLRVVVADEVPELCTDDCYAYSFINATPLPDKVSAALARRICALFFRLAIIEGVLLADTNPGNFLYSEDEDKLWLIDFGSAVVLGDAQRHTLAKLHMSRGNLSLIRRMLPDYSDDVSKMMHKLFSTFWDDACDVPGLIPIVRMVAGLGDHGGQVDDEMAVAFRGLLALIVSLKNMGVKSLPMRTELERIVPTIPNGPSASGLLRPQAPLLQPRAPEQQRPPPSPERSPPPSPERPPPSPERPPPS